MASGAADLLFRALDSNGDPVDLDQARPRYLSFVSSVSRLAANNAS